MNQFRAFVVHQAEDGLHAAVAERSVNDLPQGEVTIRVAYSSVNYKDGLAASPRGNVAKHYPLVPGIDLAGTVLHSSDPRYAAGDEVLATGYGLGVSHDGGFSEVARVPADWIVPLPQGLSMKEAMAYGTAGFTAALSIQRLEENGLTPDGGPVLVTGATGGVGSMAVAMLAKSGYEVAASTGKASEHQYLRKLGAQEIIDRSDLVPEKIRALDAQRWAGAVDPVGGRGLAYILSTVKYGGSVAVSGLTGGTEWNATVFPFILRGVNLLGIDSVYCPMEKRLNLWERMAGELKPDHLLSDIGRETSLDELPAILNDILQGKVRGRTIVKL
ncbi:Putative quinone oxidoreductase YhfP [Paenibacillus sp. CECT 9249]|uniref:NADPH:quinone oxidoreductase family protein n=1 Tax=Paenibacillus sp. CECT 9249 TaxID=2845385 RepID=UPI001E56DC07|nr:acryloyl-CoA reductase [Paenibacillus sp. CECT 9249]CAH0118211.1 Putative quinone oxidoreductase YhfP [Paenibacillus sp. CECT 9249]